MRQAQFRTIAWAALGFTLAVILWGAYVRATGSGAGCGSHWPTCNGEVIPRAKSTATIIEFTHRVTSGMAFLMTLVQLVWAFQAYPRRHAVRWGAAASMFFMLTEALVGAGLVLFELVAQNTSIARAWWMGAHLINTFLLVAAMTVTVYWASGGALPQRGKGDRVSAGVLGAGMLGALIVGVTGAIAALGDTLFPARSLAEGLAQDMSPTAHLLVQLRVLHPVVAGVVAAYLLFATSLVGARRPALRRFATALGVLVAMQIGAGLLNLGLLAPVWMQIVHLLLADLVWMALVVLAASSLADPASQQADAPATDGRVAQGA
jgi:heme A synthase